MRLVADEGRTCLRSLVCPYHQWTYGLDGALRNIPRKEMFAEVDSAKMGLVPVATEVRHGLIWVQAEGDMDLDHHLAGLGDDLEDFDIASYHFCQQSVLVVGGGDSALETAIALTQCGSDVTLAYRKAEFSRPKPDNLERLRALESDPGADVDVEEPSSERVTTAAGPFLGDGRRTGRLRVLVSTAAKEIREGERAHLLDLLLPVIQLKTLVIQGAASQVIHPATPGVIQAMMSDSHLAVIEDCGHFPMVERPQETAEHLLEFLEAAG